MDSTGTVHGKGSTNRLGEHIRRYYVLEPEPRETGTVSRRLDTTIAMVADALDNMAETAMKANIKLSANLSTDPATSLEQQVAVHQHTKHTNLYRSANGTDTKLRYRVYRALGFQTFEKLLRPDYTVRSKEELRHSIQKKLSEKAMSINKVTARSRTVLAKHIARMWLKANYEWIIQPTQSEDQSHPRTWTWYRTGLATFTKTTNKMIRKIVKRKIKILQIRTCIGIDMNAVLASWPAEAAKVGWLAPTRKDLLLRIQRNGLLLG